VSSTLCKYVFNPLSVIVVGAAILIAPYVGVLAYAQGVEWEVFRPLSLAARLAIRPLTFQLWTTLHGSMPSSLQSIPPSYRNERLGLDSEQ
jgi:hypothetical protein